MWEYARKQVADVFFKDEIELYENNWVENEIGEEFDEPVLVGTFKCNIENGTSNNKDSESGVSTMQSLRISLAKTVPLDYNKTYKIKIKTARIRFSSEWWKVLGWVEGQISTVVNASKEVSI
nr:MAG TPA: hypothetical protein [Caudoviricetes sp.]